jgi:hypothetical protein
MVKGYGSSQKEDKRQGSEGVANRIQKQKHKTRVSVCDKKVQEEPEDQEFGQINGRGPRRFKGHKAFFACQSANV